MPETPNHGLNLYDHGDDFWTHSPDMETIEERLWVHDTDNQRSEYTPHEDAAYLATDPLDLYLGDGNEWVHKGTFFEGGSGGDALAVEGIDATHANVGALCGGGYHDSRTDGDGGYGILFEAEGLTIHSVVVDADASTPDQPIELRPYNDNAVDPPVLDSVSPSLDEGAQRVDLGFEVPESGDSDADNDDLYWLCRGPEPSGDEVGLRRRIVDSGEWSNEDYDEETYAEVDFVRGGHSGDYDLEGGTAEESWYYFFDWLIGGETTRVTSPWSTDVEELYMRPRPPEEEFDDVSPRALWIDTS